MPPLRDSVIVAKGGISQSETASPALNPVIPTEAGDSFTVRCAAEEPRIGFRPSIATTRRVPILHSLIVKGGT